MAPRVLLCASLAAFCAAIVCTPGTYFRKYGPKCGEDCCECVPGFFCPGTVDGFEKMFPCPDGECSPAGAKNASQCAAPACSPAPTPGPPSPVAAVEQVHIALTGVAGEMHVSFASNVPSCSGAAIGVSYGPTPDVPLRAAAAGALLTSGMATPLCIFGATMTGLPAGTAYYKIDGSTELFSFVAGAPARAGGNVYLVMADYGAENDVAQEQLVAEGKSGSWDAIIYGGDMGYNLESDG
jgi:hypothetical protein